MKKTLTFVLVTLTLCACSSIKRTAVKYETVNTWSEWLHCYAKYCNISDEHRLSTISLIDSVYMLLGDSKTPTAELEQPICRMSKSIDEAIRTDTSFEFAQMMRATARNFGGLFLSDLERLGNNDCAVSLMASAPNLWLTVSNETGDLMCNSLFPDSWSSMDRFAYIVFSMNEESEVSYSAIILVNSIDTTIDEIVISFYDKEGNLISATLGFGEFGMSDAENGCVRLFMMPDVLMQNILNSNVMTISYNTGKDTVSMTSMPSLTIREQLDSCPRIKALINEKQE